MRGAKINSCNTPPIACGMNETTCDLLDYKGLMANNSQLAGGQQDRVQNPQCQWVCS